MKNHLNRDIYFKNMKNIKRKIEQKFDIIDFLLLIAAESI